MAKPKSIVILGGSIAGVSIAHYILRHVLPSLRPKQTYELVLVSPSKHLFFVIASPRAIARPDLVSPDSIMPEIEQAFAEYPKGSFRFIQASAKELNIDTRIVRLDTIDQNLDDIYLSYDTLIIATGTTSRSPIWSLDGPKEISTAAMAKVHSSLGKAKDIVIAGGGPAGVETAGELGYDHGKTKNITLYSGSKRLLTAVRPELGRDAESYLSAMGVKVIHNVRITTDEENTQGKTTVHLSNGETITTDLFLNATGGKPNSDFIPPKLLNKTSYLQVDEHLRVPNAGPRVYGVGSVASYSHGGILDVIDAIAPLGSVLEFDLSEGASGADKVYKRNEKEMMIVPVGRSKAVGVLFGYRVPSFFAWLIKGRTFFAENAIPYVQGAGYKKKK